MHTLLIYESMYGNTHRSRRPSRRRSAAPARCDRARERGDRRSPCVGRPGGSGRPDPCPWDADGELPLQRGGQRREPDGWSQATLDPDRPRPRHPGVARRAGRGRRQARGRVRTRGRPDPRCSRVGHRPVSPSSSREHGFTLVADPQSFIIDTHQRLRDGEEERAATWASSLVPELRDCRLTAEPTAPAATGAPRRRAPGGPPRPKSAPAALHDVTASATRPGRRCCARSIDQRKPRSPSPTLRRNTAHQGNAAIVWPAVSRIRRCHCQGQRRIR